MITKRNSPLRDFILGIDDYPKTDEECMEWVIAQAQQAYVDGRIDLFRLELDVENLLQGRTPVDSEGMPIYYDPRILDGMICSD